MGDSFGESGEPVHDVFHGRTPLPAGSHALGDDQRQLPPNKEVLGRAKPGVEDGRDLPFLDERDCPFHDGRRRMPSIHGLPPTDDLQQ